MGLSARHLTVSTVGVAPAIERLAVDAPTVTLAVSLHAANDALRDALVPLNRTYPLERVEAACHAWTAATRRRVSFEWALIDGVNDRRERRRRARRRSRGAARAHVNLIALNPTPGYATAGTPRDRVVAFRDALVRLGVNATIRATRGREIDAACGQLAAVAGARADARAAPARDLRDRRRGRRAGAAAAAARRSALGRDLVGELGEPPGEEDRADRAAEPAADRGDRRVT